MTGYKGCGRVRDNIIQGETESYRVRDVKVRDVWHRTWCKGVCPILLFPIHPLFSHLLSPLINLFWSWSTFITLLRLHNFCIFINIYYKSVIKYLSLFIIHLCTLVMSGQQWKKSFLLWIISKELIIFFS